MWAQAAAGRFLIAGWSAADVLYALENRPDGTAWLHSAFPHGSTEWVMQRLAAWMDGHGQPLPARSRVVDEQAQRTRARQAEDARARAALTAGRSDSQEAWAALARSALVRASPAAAKAVREQRRRGQVAADGWRWERADKAALAAIETGRLVEEWTPPNEEEGERVDARVLALARARTRARWERARRTRGSASDAT